MDSTIVNARKALIAACLKDGVENAAEIQQVAKDVAADCTKMQVAGVKAWLKHPEAFKK